MRTQATETLERILTAIPPAAGGMVMGTGIVSIALSLDGHETLSRVLLAIGAVAWVALGLLLAGRLLRERTDALQAAGSPVALTAVAATAVLGARLTLLGWTWAGVALLCVALASWLVLLGPVLRHWATPTTGASLLLTVSTESLAVLSAVLAKHGSARWLVDAALLPFALGLVFYVFAISRFDRRQLLVGKGDHWITGGALAISTLAAGQITLATRSTGALAGADGALEGITLVLWTLTIVWLPVLVATEALRPRLGYDVRRWSTVFPIGMYAACSFIAGTAVRAPNLAHFARVCTWVGLAVWAIVFVAMAGRGWQLVRGDSRAGEKQGGEVALSRN